MGVRPCSSHSPAQYDAQTARHEMLTTASASPRPLVGAPPSEAVVRSPESGVFGRCSALFSGPDPASDRDRPMGSRSGTAGSMGLAPSAAVEQCNAVRDFDLRCSPPAPVAWSQQPQPGADFPEGPAKAIVVPMCGGCHDINRLKAGYTAEGWRTVMRMMQNMEVPTPADQVGGGDRISDQELPGAAAACRRRHRRHRRKPRSRCSRC